MHKSIQNLILINNNIKLNLVNLKNNKIPKIIAVTKTFKIDKILPLLNYGHLDYGENKVQEAVEKWSELKLKHTDIKLHMIGKLQTNKVKFAVKLFDYIHSVDSEKLAKKIADEQFKVNKKIKIFIQVNIGEEEQKSGITKHNLENLVSFCKNLNLDVIGLMCIPPESSDPSNFFKEMNALNESFGFSELSMGMSSDYITAIQNSATFVRIGSNIFGKRS
ncbi:YggS family pyridoxal phosphate-dependent enzyme [Candidatus Pelagibacter sp.]|nr:YggS family pyridoxal phosphate-dependent enzyme [Candidatus Pelagibacter sp.]